MAQKNRQLNFFRIARKQTKLWWIQSQGVYGGSLKYRKVKRPFDSAKLIHVIFKANLPQGTTFLKRRRFISNQLQQSALKSQIKVLDHSINCNHIHLIVDAKRARFLMKFLRHFSAQVGRYFKKIMTSLGKKSVHSIWTDRPFTRLVSRGKRSLKILYNYLQKNRLEAMGAISYSPRKHLLSDFIKSRPVFQRSTTGPPNCPL